MLSPEDLAEVDAIFSDALDLDPAARRAMIDARCGTRSGVRAEVESMIAAHERAGGFMRTRDGRDEEAAAQEPIAGTMVGPWRLLE